MTEYKFKAGDLVQHKEGLHGTVTKDEDSNGLVNWKGVTAGYRTSDKSALTLVTKNLRWRK
jgi:hypothetical protein